ncbi:pyridoxal-5-phosphate-dependent protein subunit beta [Flavonifractor sp. An82]|uniref:pyridoxal-phosphate dependent enzyme n=1 Tax=Flavonifractor sp. An82 TaxID=1965660 RepID=UPI000B37261A|nr:pyridoxal-phosphate dependent enzyme [Flavonifractor sp. An82]OUN22806.1 pyridoxal-5-phosphate-dependent protein subunit beta [Flavonifractor sp. An82]
MIDLTICRQGLEHNIRIARENGVVIPTFENMIHPETVPQPIQDRLTHVGLWDVDPANLFRITWKNQPVASGGLYRSAPNYIELPPALTGVPARILCLPGKWFPTGCHKVGASFGCLAPRLVTGQFDAASQKAVWPSTGNYCRGGAFNSRLLGVHGVAILPAGMSQERFDWLASIDAEVIKTPGCESNVKEIFDKTNELSRDPSCMIFNQFAEMGNHLWHYKVTGAAVAQAFEDAKRPGDKLAGACFTSGSAGTIGCGDYLKEVYPAMKLAVGEAVQCPTILNNGFGDHRVEGIGDKHVPWIHDVKNTDMVIDVDDNDAMALLRLFNEPAGKARLIEAGVDPQLVEQLSLMGISGIANVLCCIKMAKYYELTEHDVVCTVLTDSADMYRSRLAELAQQLGEYDAKAAAFDYALHLMGLKTDCMAELGYYDRKRVHNLKYYTWVEQQGKTTQELDALWYGTEWADVHSQADALDELIRAFNEETGVLKGL